MLRWGYGPSHCEKLRDWNHRSVTFCCGGIRGVLVRCQFSGASEVPGEAWGRAQESAWWARSPGDSGAGDGGRLSLEAHKLGQDPAARLRGCRPDSQQKTVFRLTCAGGRERSPLFEQAWQPAQHTIGEWMFTKVKNKQMNQSVVQSSLLNPEWNDSLFKALSLWKCTWHQTFLL